MTEAVRTLADVAPQVDAACEGDWSVERLGEIGERIWNMERMFNNAAGFTAKDDDLPKRLKTEPAKTGPAKGLVSGIDKMKPEYYDLRGWDQSGVPSKETLERLGLLGCAGDRFRQPKGTEILKRRRTLPRFLFCRVLVFSE